MVIKTIEIGGNVTVVTETGEPVRKVATYYGLSTDVKPAALAADIFYEMDTQKVYLYDEAGKAWLEQ